MIETITTKISDEIQAWIRKQKNFIGHLLKLFSAVLLTVVVIYPGAMWRMLCSILSWNHFFISFFLEFAFAIYYITPILIREIRTVSENIKKEKDELLFCGASLEKVIDYLMTSGTFKRADIEREF
jgi:surface polysaccharide O-acyltransferase-like enzyme